MVLDKIHTARETLGKIARRVLPEPIVDILTDTSEQATETAEDASARIRQGAGQVVDISTGAARDAATRLKHGTTQATQSIQRAGERMQHATTQAAQELQSAAEDATAAARETAEDVRATAESGSEEIASEAQIREAAEAISGLLSGGKRGESVMDALKAQADRLQAFSPRIHVVTMDAGWALKAEGVAVPLLATATKSDAVSAGRVLARAISGALVLHRTDGTIHRTYSYE